MDINEALTQVVELARGSEGTTFVRPPCGPSDQFYVCRPGQTPDLVTAPPPPRAVQCSSIDGFVQAVTSLHSKLDGDVLVYVGAGGLRANLSEFGDRRDCVAMPLCPTDQMTAVHRLVKTPMKQSDLVWELRSTLAGCCTHPQFPTMVRKLKIKNNEDGERTVSVGRESIGASVVREMSGIDGDLPETIEFVVPVYEEVFDYARGTQRHTETIELAVRVDLQEGTFVFRPTGSSLLDAAVNARRQAVVQLREKFGDVATVIEESNA